MWKHLNIRDKHKYYETATKARTMYNLPELPYLTGNIFNFYNFSTNISIIKDNIIVNIISLKFKHKKIFYCILK